MPGKGKADKPGVSLGPQNLNSGLPAFCLASVMFSKSTKNRTFRLLLISAEAGSTSFLPGAPSLCLEPDTHGEWAGSIVPGVGQPGAAPFLGSLIPQVPFRKESTSTHRGQKPAPKQIHAR